VAQAPAFGGGIAVTAMSDARRRWDVVFGIVLVVVFAYAAITALRYPEEARLLPLAVAIPGLVLAVVHVVLSVRPQGTAAAEPVDENETLTPAERTRRTAQIAAWIVGIFVSIYLVGFQIAVPLAAIAYLRVMAREGWLMSAGIAVLCWALVFGIFDRVLHVPLPTGQLLRMLGVT
jgi:DMSO reductase anchor subunit